MLMRHALLVVLSLAAVPLFADVDTLVREGIALHDAGKYDEAVAKFTTALNEDPGSELAAYELGLTYFAKGDNARCVAFLEPRAKKRGKFQAPMHAILGNCHDHAGDSKRAAAAYRRGLKIDSNDTQLLYNLAITLIGQGEWDEARKLLKKELALTPQHATGHYALGQVFETQGYRVQAALSYLRFLAFAPQGERATDAAHRAVALLGAGVKVEDAKNVTITVDSKPRKGEGDYGVMEMMVALAGAVKVMPPEKDAAPKSDFDKTREQVRTSLAMIVEMQPKGKDHTATVNVPFFRTLYDRKLLETFAGIAVMPVGLTGTKEWLQANRAAVDSYVAFINGK